jgi:uncharacterized secreted protein with C-terminal beta-propeller domain
MSSHDEQDFERVLERSLSNASKWEGSPHAMFRKIRRQLYPQPWYKRIRPLMAVSATALSLMLALGIHYYSRTAFTPIIPDDQAPNSGVDVSPIAPVAKVLPVVGTAERLRELIVENLNVIQPRSAKRSISFNADLASGYSETNVQVQGVDEADIVHTDGQYLYQIRGQEITLSQIYPQEAMQVISRIKLPEAMHPLEMYVDEQYLTVVAVDSGPQNLKRRMPHSSTTKILVYEIADKNDPVKIREVAVDGSVLSSRKIGSVVYLVAQKWVSEEAGDDVPAIYYRDSAQKNEQSKVGLDMVRYFPNSRHEAFLTVLSLDVADGTKQAKVDVYLGSGRNLYMSQDNLYIALEQWKEPDEKQGGTVSTLVHRFEIFGTDVVYQGMGEVPGTILNQFSMDEHNGYFRIATTSRSDEMTNNVYILDQEMTVVGTLEGLAPGEQIYSARFMGDKGYLVTFELIDPLFVIDLKDPTNPQVLGELKIPGFSNYLHPLDDTTLLGLGRDTEVIVSEGRPVVRQKGLKLAIFDVSDVNNPKELYVETIGDEGSYSEGLWNHKAVMFYQGVFAIPVSVTRDGQTEYQGAMAYQVSREDGFTLMGRVSHYTNGNPATDGWAYDRDVLRSLIINDVLYTVSNEYVKANGLSYGLPDLANLSLK